MQNLKFPRTIVLINSLSVTDPKIGLFGDLENGRRYLTVKGIGSQIPGATFAAGALNATTEGAQGTSFPAGVKVVKSCTDDGDLSAWRIELNATCPCEECDYNYGITLVSRLRDPGYTDNDEYKPKLQWYGGKIDRISCTAGLIDDDHLLVMEDDILDQITNHADAWVDAYRIYAVSVDTTSALSSIDITDENGTTTTVVSGAATNVALCDAINADATVNLYVEAFIELSSGTSNDIIIKSLNPGYKFTVAANVTTTVDKREILIIAKDVNRKIIPNIETAFATFEKCTYIDLRTTTTAGTTTPLVTVSGVSTSLGAANDNTTVATYATNLNALSTLDTTGVLCAYGNPTGDYTIFWGTSTVDRVRLTFSALSTTTIAVNASGEGHFPYLTSDDVFRIFAHSKHMGKFSDMVYPENPVEGARYCHYYLESSVIGEPNLHGASHQDGYKQRLDIYIHEDYITTDIYDKDTPGTDKCFNKDTETATPDTNFEELLAIWANCQIASW